MIYFMLLHFLSVFFFLFISFLQISMKEFDRLPNCKFIAMGMTLLLLLLLLGLWFKLVLRWSCWYYIGYVDITLVALVFLWLCWYFVGCYPLTKC